MTRLRFRYSGAIAGMDPAKAREMLDRASRDDEALALTVSSIIEIVRRDGDSGLAGLAREFDGVSPDALEVPREAVTRALDTLDSSLREAMERSIASLRAVHLPLRPVATEVETSPGVTVGRRPDPLSRVGVYAPGGRSPYPSSVLMGVVPARVAGVGEVILCSPPARGGVPPDVILAAAELAGVDRVFAIGGAGAIAAMAYGTASVPRVDRIVGPGNAWVTEAKAQVSRVVGIDVLAGPSELIVILDEEADLQVVAREMLAQAEHDPRACVFAVCVGDGDHAQRLEDALASMAPGSSRRRVIADAFATRGGVLAAQDMAEAVAFTNAYAPEHLLLAVREPDVVFASVRNAGTVCLGETSSVAFADYATGANHVLPTGGLARSVSGLSTEHFIRWTNYQRVSTDAARRLARGVELMATAESLDAHARAASAWGNSV